jgi:cysteinyl-tRNA synthetase
MTLPTITVHNSLTRAEEPLVPRVPGKVGLYVCGITVYDLCHLGHARMIVAFDVIQRYLKAAGYQVDYVRNITDIDDKIIKRAAENGEPIGALTARMILAMDEDFAALGCERPTREPRATQHVPGMIRMIATLESKGHAYAVPGGDVYYKVSSFPEYGRLSGKDPADLRAGARVEVDERKHDPLDFVLWKQAKPGEWHHDSPWGLGRPGWHIECSVMSHACLGEEFDIHGGGMDLKFPHHENEIAQSRAASGKGFARYWLHNGFVTVDDEKMSKSLGNFFTIREVLARYAPEVVRFMIVRSHYRSPLNHSDAALDEAKAGLDRLYIALRGGVDPDAAARVDLGPGSSDPAVRRFHAAMQEDFNTSDAIAVLFELANEANAATDDATKRAKRALLGGLGGILGLLQQDPEAYLKGGAAAGGPSDAEVEALIARRLAARKAKDWKESDRIRDLLKAQGVVLEDGPGGTTWRRG